MVDVAVMSTLEPSITRSFLKHVLPDHGLYAVAVFMPRANGRSVVRHHWTNSLDALATEIIAADNCGEVYHACASFQDRNRRRTSALGARSLWLDVDAGEEAQKKNPEAYTDATQAFHAVEAFRRALGLPAPTYVASGTGLHVYWALASTLDPQTWKRYAEGLKTLCVKHGLVAGPERTADIASILRPPGTHHRKGQPTLVECGELTGPYEIDQFEVLLRAAPPPKDQPRTVNNHSVAGRLAKVFERRSVSADHIAAQCAQVARLRDEEGRIPEPPWYAALGVLAYCEGGDDLAHEWSAGHPNYSHAETQAKLDRWRGSVSGATTCERFHSLEQKTCEACTHWQKIKSPISLGLTNDRTDEPLPADKPRLLIEDCNPDRTVAALRDILIGSGELYDRGVPVRLTFDQMQRGTVAQVISPDALVLMAHAACRPHVVKAKKDGSLYEADARLPRPFAVMYLDWRGEWRLPPLNGIATAPLLQDNGAINTAQGYDTASGMWCGNVPDLTGLVPERPTKDQAATALGLIRATFNTFCFADAETFHDVSGGVAVVNVSKPPGRDESAFLVALLTAVCRPSLHLAPGVLLRAAPMSGAGAGKGLLARCICIIAFGREPHAVTAGATAEELEKRIAAELIEGSPALFLDNLNNTAFKSSLLASAITERPARVRLLGRSQMVPLNATAFVILTGNGLTVSEDLARRFVAVDFDPRTEDPEARPFTTDIRAEVAARRKELLAALLTIWRWGRIATDIGAGISLGSFEQWCRWVRDPLLALGCQDPAERVREAKERDGRRQSIADLFAIWWERYRDKPIAARQLQDDVKHARDPQGRGRQYQASQLEKLAGTRMAGFVFTRQAATGKWGVATYALEKTGSAQDHRDHRGHRVASQFPDAPDAPYAFGDFLEKRPEPNP